MPIMLMGEFLSQSLYLSSTTCLRCAQQQTNELILEGPTLGMLRTYHLLKTDFTQSLTASREGERGLSYWHGCPLHDLAIIDFQSSAYSIYVEEDRVSNERRQQQE